MIIKNLFELSQSERCWVLTEDEIAQFLGVAGFGHGFEEDDKKLPAVQQNLDKEFVNNYSVKQRYARFMYLFQDEQLDDLPMAKKNGTVLPQLFPNLINGFVLFRTATTTTRPKQN